MIVRVHIHPKVEKLLTQMKKHGKASLLAAERAETVIKNLIKGVRPINAGSSSKNVRTKNRYNFNLGSGYRLICIREKYDFFILFIGSHDNCDIWLNKHKGKKNPYKKGLSMNTYDVMNVPDTQSEELACIDEIEDDSSLMSKITEKDLRKIFRGLINNRQGC